MIAQSLAPARELQQSAAVTKIVADQACLLRNVAPRWGRGGKAGSMLRARGARQGPRTSRPEKALSVPSRIPMDRPLRARAKENVGVWLRSQVGLIRHGDQEIDVQFSRD